MREADRSRAQAVADAIRATLLDGELAPGSWLREEDLAARFSVSRYTVRAALAALVSSGLLVHERNRGVCVPELTAQRIDDLYAFRAVVELGALRMALDHRSDLTDVEFAVRALEALDDDAPWGEVTTAHERIHHAIVDAAGNSRLLAAFDTCTDELRFMTALVRTDLSARQIARLHRELMDGLHRGGDVAVAALTFDIQVSGRDAMVRALERHTRFVNGIRTGRSA